jgi:hypothetical protein
MTTNGNRPPRPEESYLRPAAYSPRRRRNDTIVTGIIGFVVGAIAGIGSLGMVVLIAFVTEVLIGFVGYVAVIVGVALVAGIFLAITAVRSST